MNEVAEVFRILASNITLKILSVLSAGELSLGQITEVVGVNDSVVSRKLKVLKELGLVECSWVRSGNRNIKVCYLKKNYIDIKLTYPSPAGSDLCLLAGHFSPQANHCTKSRSRDIRV